MSVTELRDRQNAEWHAWAERNPDKARAHNRRRRDQLAAQTADASRNGEPWAEWEFDLAMSDTPLREVAIRLGRTYSSVVRARQRRRRMLGLGIEHTKTESDPYDGESRVGVLYVKDTA